MTTELLIDIALLLLGAKLLGEITERAGFSSLVGEILAGILLGPVFHIISPNGVFEQIVFFGILFLLFIIGLSTKYDDIRKNVYTGSFLAVSGAVLTFLGGLAAGWYLFGSFDIGLFLGVAMISTSTAIPLKILIEKGEFQTRVGRMLVVISVADDIVAILALSILTTYFTAGGVNIWNVFSLFFAVLGFILVVLTFGSKVVARMLSFLRFIRDEQMLLSLPIVIIFVTAFLSDSTGVAAVTGAFLAGITMSKSQYAEPVILPKFRVIGYGFFIPLFFAYSGMLVDVGSISSNWHIVLLLFAIGCITKSIGSGFFARFFGFNAKEQATIAVGMIPRGEYGIVISQIALSVGVITGSLYTLMLSFVILTIIATPLLFRLHAAISDRYWKGY